MQTGFGAGLPAISISQILPKNLTMDNPRYEGYGDDGTSYTFTAKTAQQDLATPNKIILDAISGTIFSADKARTDVTAARGIFDRKKSILELLQRIDVNSESGLKATLSRATLFTKTSVLVTNYPVVVEFPSGTVRSQKMTLKQKERQVSFVDKVEMRLKPEPQKAAEPAPAAKTASASTPFLSPSSEPVDITSARLDVDDNTKISLFTGDVLAKQGDATLSTPELEVTYEGDAAGNAVAKPAAGSGPSGKLRRIVAKTPVVMTRGDADRVTSDTADFDALNETAVLNGSVVMTSGDDRRMTGDRADLDQRADTALLTGETVVVVQGKNELRGRRLYVDRKAGHTQLTSPPGGGRGPGRVTAHLVRGEEKPERSTKTAARDTSKEAAAGSTGLASFATDPNAPVDVEADQLDVMDNTKVAVFRGGVRAVQGGFVVTSAELHAFYQGDASLADATQSTTAGAKQGSAELTRIEAKKNVVVTSKDGQRAEGDWANFDAKSQTVTVGGDDVVLTQGQNVVHGTRLVIDMRSGESTIDTAPAKTVSKPGGGGWVTEAPEAAEAVETKGRASAIFFPQQIRDANAAKSSAKETPKFAPDGWQAQTAPDGAGTGGN